MTAAPEALRRLVAHGFQIEAHNGKLRIHPADRLTPEQRDWISAHKAEWLALLTASNDAAGHPCHPCHPCHPKTPQSENFADIESHEGLHRAVYRGEIQSEPPHKMYERPLGDCVRCVDCRHAVKAPDSDDHSWRLCTTGSGGAFAKAWHFCEQWEVTA